MKKNLIVNFHVVNDTDWFEKVILMLKLNFTLVDLSFFENPDNYNKKGFCHITFDDGDRTFYTAAYPILKKYNVPTTIFVSPKSASNCENFWFQEVRDYKSDILNEILSQKLVLPIREIKKIGYKNILKSLTLNTINEVISLYQKKTNTKPKPFQNMNLAEILEVEKSGLVTVGAHTLNHPILKNESDETCYNEISGSIIGLQKELGHEVKYFAYPNGTPHANFGEREINFLREANITIAVTTELRYIAKDDSRFAIPRIGLSYGSKYFVKMKLTLVGTWEVFRRLLQYSKEKRLKKISTILYKASQK